MRRREALAETGNAGVDIAIEWLLITNDTDYTQNASKEEEKYEEKEESEVPVNLLVDKVEKNSFKPMESATSAGYVFHQLIFGSVKI